MCISYHQISNVSNLKGFKDYADVIYLFIDIIMRMITKALELGAFLFLLFSLHVNLISSSPLSSHVSSPCFFFVKKKNYLIHKSKEPRHVGSKKV